MLTFTDQSSSSLCPRFCYNSYTFGEIYLILILENAAFCLPQASEGSVLKKHHHLEEATPCSGASDIYTAT